MEPLYTRLQKPTLTIQIERVSGVLVVTLSGNLNRDASEFSILDTLKSIEDEHKKKVVFDLSRTIRPDSYGFGLFVGGFQHVSLAQGKCVCVIGEVNKLRYYINTLQLGSLLPEAANRDEAIAALNSEVA